jgi:KDO2-lipid IV(A) lauroyltransferase
MNMQYLIARLLLGAFAILPVRVGFAVSAAMARVFFLFSGKLRRVGERNLEIAFPDLTSSERQRLLRGCFANLGRLLAVFAYVTNQPRELKSLIDCEGLEHLETAEKRGRGVILFTGHIGAWELSSFGLSLFGHPLSFLVRRIDNPKIEAMIDRARTRLGNRTIDKRSAAREMLQIMQSGGTLGILVDLNTLDREGIFVNFFGVPASTTFTLAKLALRTDAQVLPVFAPWDESRKRFVLKIDEPLKFESTGDETD